MSPWCSHFKLLIQEKRKKNTIQVELNHTSEKLIHWFLGEHFNLPPNSKYRLLSQLPHIEHTPPEMKPDISQTVFAQCSLMMTDFD